MGATSIAWTDRVWRQIPNWPNYEVSNDGSVRRAGRLLHLRPSDSGHLYFAPVRGKKCYAHRAVLEAFVGPCPAGCEGRHLDGAPTHNAVENLAWGTRLENVADKQRHGTQPRGEQTGTAKLTEAQVREIRRVIGTTTLRELAARFGVSHTAIRRAAKGIKWSHVA